MMSFPLLRSAVRIGLGRRPHQRDLDRLIERLRGRLLRGESLKDPARWKLPQGFVLDRLRGLQLRKLRRTVELARRWVPHYERTLADWPTVRTLEDYRRLPITRRSDLEANPSSFISRAPGLTASVPMSTSGTTGRRLSLWLSPEEFEYYASVQAIAGMLAGFLGPSRILQVSVPLGNSITARIVAEAARRSGATTLLPGLRGTLDEHLDSLLAQRDIPGKSPAVTNLLCSPAFLWALTARAEASGRDLSKSRLDNLFCYGAKVDDQLRRRVERTWGIGMKQGYSLSETPGTGAIECEQGRLHFLDASGLLEVVDPESLEPLPPGETGMALITTLIPDRELQPLLRYRTGDVMRLSPETRCDCGRPSTIIEEIEGRTDQVGEELVAHPELVQPPRYSVTLERTDSVELCILSIELTEPLSVNDLAELATRLRRGLELTGTQHESVGAVRTELRFLPRGGLAEPFPFKLADTLHV